MLCAPDQLASGIPPSQGSKGIRPRLHVKRDAEIEISAALPLLSGPSSSRSQRRAQWLWSSIGREVGYVVVPRQPNLEDNAPGRGEIPRATVVVELRTGKLGWSITDPPV